MKNRKKLLLPLLLSLIFILSSCGGLISAPPLEYDNLQGVVDRLYGDGYYFFNPGEGFVREHFIISAFELINLERPRDRGDSSHTFRKTAQVTS